MAEGNSIKDEIKAEHKKMKDMNIFQKIAYIFGYYKLRFLVIFLVVGALVALAISIYKNNYERSFTCVIFDGKLSGTYDRTDWLTTNFTDYLGLDGKSQRVIIDTNWTFKQEGIDTTAFTDIDNLLLRARTQSIDGYISEYKYCLIFNTDDSFFLEDLREYFSAEELEQLSDYIIYYTMKDGSQVPLSVDISSSKFITEANIKGIEQPCYGIVTSSLHKENAANFIRFLFGMDKVEYEESESTAN